LPGKYIGIQVRRPSGAKAQPLFCCVCGTTEVVPFQSLRRRQSFTAAGAARADSVGYLQGLKRVRRNRKLQATEEKSGPQGLKPGFYFSAFVARLKSCPFKACAGSRVFHQFVESCPFKACAGSRVFQQFVESCPFKASGTRGVLLQAVKRRSRAGSIHFAAWLNGRLRRDLVPSIDMSIFMPAWPAMGGDRKTSTTHSRTGGRKFL